MRNDDDDDAAEPIKSYPIARCSPVSPDVVQVYELRTDRRWVIRLRVLRK